MTKRRKLTWSIILCFVGVVVYLFVWPALPISSDGSPVYEGRSLAEWVDDYPRVFWDTDEPQRQRFKKTFSEIGTNGLPYLTKWLAYEEPRLRVVCRFFANEALHALDQDWRFRNCRAVRAAGATYALRAMGPAVAPAVPELQKLFLIPGNSAAAERAQRVLCDLGTLSVPAYAAALTNTDSEVRFRASSSAYGLRQNGRPLIGILVEGLKNTNTAADCAMALGKLRLEPEVTVPALASGLSSQDWKVRYYAAVALGHHGDLANAATPALVAASNDTNGLVSSAAADALDHVDPERIYRSARQ